jgi:hypothetical protein
VDRKETHPQALSCMKCTWMLQSSSGTAWIMQRQPANHQAL